MIRHIVLLTFADDTPSGHLDVVMEKLGELPAVIPEIRNYELLRDLGRTDGNAHLSVVADFDDHDGYLAYSADATHQQVIADHIRPHLAARTATQSLL